MLVGGRWSGWSRAWVHTGSYARSYCAIGFVTALCPPLVIVHLLSMIVILPGAFGANLLFVRLFPQKSWIRERDRGWIAGLAGLLLAWVGTITWLLLGGGPPDSVSRLGEWGTAIYFIGIPVFFSNLGVLIGYLPPRRQAPE
jgi:hypothetical protein